MYTGFSSTGARIFGTAKGCAVRLLIHIGSLLTLLFVFMATSNVGASVLTFVGSYVALINIFGSSLGSRFGGFVPLIAGLAQIGVSSALGTSLWTAVLAGGVQAWLQQVLIGRTLFKAYTSQSVKLAEWIALFLLFIMGLAYTTGGLISPDDLMGFGLVFIAVVILLWPGALVGAKRKTRAALKTISAMVDQSNAFPDMLGKPVSRFLDLANKVMSTGVFGSPTRVFPFSRSVDNLEKDLLGLYQRQPTKDVLLATERLFSDLKQVNESLERDLMRRNKQGTEMDAKKIAERQRAKKTFDDTPYLRDITALTDLRAVSDPVLRPKIDAISRTAQNILDAMYADPADVPEGQRFLHRYLKAARAIVEDYNRLGPGLQSTDTGKNALVRATDMLSRLESAFAAEHALLLKNDHLAFVADLNTLDRLLDMESGNTKSK